MMMDGNQMKMNRQKNINQTLERFHKDIIAHRDFYIKIRKEYDKITIYENIFNRTKERQKEYKDLKRNIKKIVEKFFFPMFP